MTRINLYGRDGAAWRLHRDRRAFAFATFAAHAAQRQPDGLMKKSKYSVRSGT